MHAVVRRLAAVSVGPPMVHANGDRAQYLDHTFACDHVSGEPHPADDESVAAAWFPLDALPPMAERHRRSVEDVLRDEVATRLH